MAENSNIEWTNSTWNPIRSRNLETGKAGWHCEKVSHGCTGCYAEKMNANTYFGNGLPYKASSLPQIELFLDEKMLRKPLSWRTPRKIFVCSMTDLFGRFVKDEWIDRIFAVMALAPQHTFQVLTKRPERMRDYLVRKGTGSYHLFDVAKQFRPDLKDKQAFFPLPLRNVWFGTSIEDQKTADERIPLLLQTPAAVRFVSAEPLLEAVGLTSVWLKGLDWLIVGGESGKKARPLHPQWARDLRDQCIAYGVPYFFKQWGEFIETQSVDDYTAGLTRDVWSGMLLGLRIWMKRVGKKQAGRLLDGKEWNQMPVAVEVSHAD